MMAWKRPWKLRLTLWFVIIAYLLKHFALPMTKETKQYLGYHANSLLNFTELCNKYGYKSEEHEAITEDGYILTIFRVAKSKNCNGPVIKTPVLLVHGLFECSDIFLDAGPKNALGYLLPDACFDLWVGNQRGNYYGRHHINLDPNKDAEYWNFSAEEMGSYDLPAMYDYILNYTGSYELTYIGYSQGGANFFIMCSERPKYCQMTNLMIGLAPAAIITNIESSVFVILSQMVLFAKPFLDLFGVNEILSKGGFVQEFFEFFCQYTGTYVTDVLCGSGGVPFDSFHPGSMSYETQRSAFGHFPAGTSIRNVARYGQIIKSGRFQKYDYGEGVNLERYGSPIPPEINISAVTVPVVTIHGKNDILTVSKDMESLEEKLPNLVDAVKIKDPLWTHLDIIYSQFANEVIFPVVKEYIDKYSKS